MSESVVADFVGRALHEGHPDPEPVRCRILLSEDRLVLAADDGRTTIPLDDVYDVTRSQVPEALEEFLDQTVLVGYRDGNAGRRVIVSGEHDSIRRFTALLYRTVLDGSRTFVRGPTVSGGRVLDAEGTEALLDLREESVAFVSEDSEVAIPAERVVAALRRERTVQGTAREVVEITYEDDGAVRAVEVCHGSDARQHVLWRFLRQQYLDEEGSVTDYDTAPVEEEILVGLHAGLEPEALVDVLEMDPTDVITIVRSLRDEDFVADPEAGELTTAGRIGAMRYFHDAV